VVGPMPASSASDKAVAPTRDARPPERLLAECGRFFGTTQQPRIAGFATQDGRSLRPAIVAGASARVGW
jgi:hypothetical protein